MTPLQKEKPEWLTRLVGALGPGSDALCAALDEFADLCGPNAVSWITRSPDPYSPTNILVYIVSPGILHKLCGQPDQQAGSPDTRRPLPEPAVTKGTYIAAPVASQWVYSLSVTRTQAAYGSAPKIERSWSFETGPAFGTLKIHSPAEHQREADPDPAAFAHALATQITEAQGRRVDAG